MLNVDQALEYILGDTPSDGTYRQEALEMHKELQHRKTLRDKKYKQDYRYFKREMIRKSTKKKI